MLKTIIIGSCVMVQGVFVRQADNGEMTIRVGDKLFAGTPVPKAA